VINKIAKYFKLNKVLKEKITLLEQEAELQQELLISLEEENTKLKDSVVSSVDLVSNYKNGMLQMRQYMEALMTERFSEGHQFNENENENEEEDELDVYKSLRKKTTIH